MISKEAALSIARTDAQRVYGSLDTYDVQVREEDGCWRIDYELSNPELHGGGPHYLIDTETGEIVSKRYEQ